MSVCRREVGVEPLPQSPAIQLNFIDNIAAQRLD